MNKKIKNSLVVLAALTLAGCSEGSIPESIVVPGSSVTDVSSESKVTSGSDAGSDTSKGSAESSSTTKTSEGSGQSSSGAGTSGITEWPSDVEEAMMTYLGEVIPVIGLDAETIDFYWDSDYDCLLVYDENEVDLIDDYKATLVDLGYEYYVDSYENDCYVNEDETYEILPYYDAEGGEGYLPGNCLEIYVYATSYGEVGVPLTEWPADFVDDCQATLGAVIPFVGFDSGTFGYTAMKEYGVLYAYDENETDLMTGYLESLLTAGFTTYQYYGSTYYVDPTQTYELWAGWEEADDEYAAGNMIMAYLYEEGDDSSESSSESVDENWYDYYLENDYTYSSYWCDAVISSYFESEVTIPEATVGEEGLVYFTYDKTESNQVNILVYGSVLDDYYETLEDLEYDIEIGVSSMASLFSYETVDVICASDPTHDLTMYIYEGNDGVDDLTYFTIRYFDETWIDTVTTETAWNTESSADMVEAIGEEIPFIALGDYYEFTDAYYENYGCYCVEDSYFKNLVEGYGDTLVNAGYTLIDDEESDYDGFYTKVLDNGNTLYIEYYWNFGNMIDIYVDEPLPVGYFDFSSEETLVSESEDKVVFKNGEHSITINKGSSTTAANNNIPDGATKDDARVYPGMTVVFEWGEAERPETIVIEVEVTGKAKAANITGSTVAGGVLSYDSDNSTITITVDSTAENVVLTVGGSGGHIRMENVQFN